MNQQNQSGQIIISGMAFLILCLLISGYFLFTTEIYFRNYSNTEKARQEILKKTVQIANDINLISVNNQTILAAISTAQNAFSQSAELGIYTSYAQPYWETYKLFNTKKEIKVKNTALTSNSKDKINSLYKTYSLRSAAGLFIAKSLTEKNTQLVNSLPKNISSYFSQSTITQSFCLALETQSSFYETNGFYPLVVGNYIYNFSLKKNNCIIKHIPTKLNKVINIGLTILGSSENDTIFSYKEFDTIINDNHYGIWYVKPSLAHEFLSELSFASKASVEPSQKFIIISKMFHKISYFKNLQISHKKLTSTYSKEIMTRITHPSFICSQEHNWNGDFLSEEDFTKIKQCNISKNHFLHSFFAPKWTAIISQEREK